MRAYVNSGKYLADTDNEIDYSSNGIYSNLPSELQSVIIDTYVVSGYGSKDSANFTTIDKIYLFSPHEIWNDVDGNTSSGIDYYDKSYNNTRQLDYNAGLNVTTSNYSMAIKKRTGTNYSWWLRSSSANTHDIYLVNANGSPYPSISSDARGVSPAFRLG